MFPGCRLLKCCLASRRWRDLGITARIYGPSSHRSIKYMGGLVPGSLGCRVLRKRVVAALPLNRILPFVTLAFFVASTIYRPLIMFNFFSCLDEPLALWLDHLLHREVKVASKGFPVLLKNGIAWFGLVSYSFYLWHEPILLHWQRIRLEAFE